MIFVLSLVCRLLHPALRGLLTNVTTSKLYYCEIMKDA